MDTLGNRMKSYYEEASQTKLLRRTPIVIRIDGRAFHSFTHGLHKPFDSILMETMQDTMKYLCENIQGCVLGYTQSDEISLVLIDYQSLNADAWFGNKVQKIVSVSASLATLEFNRAFRRHVGDYKATMAVSFVPQSQEELKALAKYRDTLDKCLTKGAVFDSRAFNVPREEVTNYLFWRQLDAERNSVQSVAQANFSPKQLEGLSCGTLIHKLEEEKMIVWGDYPTDAKRGSCCIKTPSGWSIDHDIPRFYNEGRAYVEPLIAPGDPE